MITKINGTISFNGSARFAKNSGNDECDMLTFKSWSKNGKERIYINDYKRRTIGYIDVTTGEVVINDRQGNYESEIETAIEGFIAEYVAIETAETEADDTQDGKAMTARYTDGKMTFTVGGKTIVTDNDIYYSYRRHINGWRCTCPESWVCLNGTDEDGNFYTIWYKCEDNDDPEALESIDWKQPYDIENEYSDRVWSSED